MAVSLLTTYMANNETLYTINLNDVVCFDDKHTGRVLAIVNGWATIEDSFDHVHSFPVTPDTRVVTL